MGKIRLLLAAAVMAVVIAACGGPGNRVVENPQFIGANTSNLTITEIAITDSTTVLACDVKYIPGWWIKISPESFIVADGKEYKLISADSIKLGEEVWMPESGEIKFHLTFPAIPSDTKYIDFCEDYTDGWQIWGIDLTGKGYNYTTHPSLPADIKKAGEGEVLADPLFETGNVTVNLHVLDYRPIYGDKYTIAVTGIGSPLPEEATATLDSEGKASVTVPIYGTSLLYVVCDKLSNARSVYPSIHVAPGETIDLYLDPGYIGKTMTGKKGNAGIPALYHNGKYAALDRGISDFNSKYSESMPSDSIKWNDTPEVYMAKAKEKLRKYIELIDSSEANESVKEYIKARAKGDLLYSAVYPNTQLHNSFYREHPDFDGNPSDSINFELSKENLEDMIKDADIDSEKVMLASIQLYPSACQSLESLGLIAEGSLPADASTFAAMFAKANTGNLTDAEIESAKFSKPFYAKALKERKALAEKRLAKLAEMTEKTPEVADDKVFDAIVEQYKGKVVLVDLWNTWCGPCRAALAANEPLKGSELSDPDIVWIYLADESSDPGKYMNMIPGIKGRHYRLNSSQIRNIRKRFDVDGIPYYILVDRSGKATGHPDYRDHDKMKEGIKAALANK